MAEVSSEVVAGRMKKPAKARARAASVVKFDVNVANAVANSLRGDPGAPKFKAEKGAKEVDIDLSKVSNTAVTYFLAHSRHNSALQNRIIRAVGGVGPVGGVLVNSPGDLFRALLPLTHENRATVKIKIGSRTACVPVTVEHRSTLFGELCIISCTYRVFDQIQSKREFIISRDFKGGAMTVLDVLEKFEMSLCTREEAEAQHEAVARTTDVQRRHGLLMNTSRPVLYPARSFFGSVLTETRLGAGIKPRQVLVEGELEVDQESDRYSQNEKVEDLPYVRAFSLDAKMYVYAHIDDLEEHAYDKDGMDKIVLPEEMRSILSSVFTRPNDAVFGDIFRNRHGGMVVLANGPSGVGKTLTAEVFAEYTGRPLYSMQMGEIGTNLEKVEESLQLIFERAARWNAVLLFDEADIFLTKRNENLERSAIVGVFLRLLDRYEGMFFLTTNRADVIDDAFKSRITLKLEYPALSPDSRLRIWDSALKASGLEVEPDRKDAHLLSEVDVNGRQIRNVVRLVHAATEPGARVSYRTLVDFCKYAAR